MIGVAEHVRVDRFEDHLTDDLSHAAVHLEQVVDSLPGILFPLERKPDVMASARLLELVEMPCMDALREHIAPHGSTLGTRQHVEHRGAVVIGARLRITARCAAAQGAYSEWRVMTVHDGH
ncbi:hypothetical protein QRX50_49060 [Amycolatopsis carbonis]|uniref:Fluoroacetyl-CoA-specific thioesterase-like domain-containing protein n=1 Tax=Amycolatopsis carbonis TaxID=715471 RepID=A0A9Y2IIG5_9PSEU|nr:hypothetical protein [Amycolatopsis sp. 2-15]WIX79188.1 hypothetical protein QRX50_49060 [Amycolatopsis sp. 2-15]